MTNHTFLPPPPTEHGKPLWQPTLDQINNSQVTDFARYVLNHAGFDWGGNFQALWQWSVNDMNAFWKLLWEWHGIVGDIGSRSLINKTEMPGAQFFPDAKLNFAENLLVVCDPLAYLSLLVKMIFFARKSFSTCLYIDAISESSTSGRQREKTLLLSIISAIAAIKET